MAGKLLDRWIFVDLRLWCCLYIAGCGVSPLLCYLERKYRPAVCIPSCILAFCKSTFRSASSFFVYFLTLFLCWVTLEGRNLVGFTREWDFFFLRFFYISASGGSTFIIERYTRSTLVSPAFLECCFSFHALYNVPYRLFCLPPLYRRLGIKDPYFGRPLPSQPKISLLEMSQTEESSFEESSTSGSNSSGSTSLGSLPPPSVFDRGSRDEIPG